MKRILALVLMATLLCTALASCGGDSNLAYGKDCLAVSSQLDALNGLLKGDADIAVIDDVGVPSELGKKNGEAGMINELLRTKPTGLILQTRLPVPAFEEIFGESCADIVRRFAQPYTAGCQSRRKWGAA